MLTASSSGAGNGLVRLSMLFVTPLQCSRSIRRNTKIGNNGLADLLLGCLLSRHTQ